MLRPPQRVRLQIVPSSAIRPHEIADAAREERIERRLRADRVLRDPVLVGTVPDLDGYVLLDGTNRQRALTALGLPWVMAQILNYSDAHAVRLETWCHGVRAPLAELIAGIGSIEGLLVARLHPLEALDTLQDTATVAVLIDKQERVVLRRSAASTTSLASQLLALVRLYENRMTREDCDAEAVEEHAARLQSSTAQPTTLVAFPRFSRSHVVSMAMEDELVPAGITRHIILEGRALRVNLPLDALSQKYSLQDADNSLRHHLDGLRPRHYIEPTILFDG